MAKTENVKGVETKEKGLTDEEIRRGIMAGENGIPSSMPPKTLTFGSPMVKAEDAKVPYETGV